MKTKKPMIKLTVGGLHIAFNTPDENGGFDPKAFEETVRNDVIKSVGTTENADSQVVRSSGIDYATVNSASSTELGVEVVALHPDDIARMRAEIIGMNGLVLSGGSNDRPFFALGIPVIKTGGAAQLTWYPKCQLIDNSDDIATSEESFSEQNDTLTIKAYAFNDAGNIKTYVNTEMTKFKEGITASNFFDTVIVEDSQLELLIEGA